MPIGKKSDAIHSLQHKTPSIFSFMLSQKKRELEQGLKYGMWNTTKIDCIYACIQNTEYDKNRLSKHAQFLRKPKVTFPTDISLSLIHCLDA